jgi:fatty-acyl-CoA synthase
VLKNSEARFVFFDSELWPTVEQVARELDFPRDRLIAIGGEVPSVTRYEDVLTDAPATLAEDDESAAVVTYTSGTTGKPKGAVRRFPREVFVSTLEFIAQTPMRADDVHLAVCPLYHMTAYGFLTFTHVLGGTVVIADEFKPETFLSLVDHHRVTSTALVPTMLHRLIALGEPEIARHRTRSLRAIYCGGSALTGQLAAQAMDALGDVLYNFYGATETGLVTLATPADLRAAPGTIGRALPHNEIVLVDDSGQPVRPGEVGELYVKNGQLVAGYHGDEAATRNSMLGDRFSVGDLARVDRQGRYFIEGRKRDMIITGGVNVYPTEIESAIEEHPSVFEAAVVGVADAEWGERVKAFVVAKPGVSIDEADLKAYLRGKVASPKIPREYAFVASLPRNATGKVLKRELAGL